MRSVSTLLITLCITTLLSPPHLVVGENVTDVGGDEQCAEVNSYMCPSLSSLCSETVYVSDCLDCDGYLSTDFDNNACFDRKLLADDHLWRDLVAMFIWFIAAGVATACGVGGGGIYVPLGMLLLNFAPKQSSGLSQASIFGASLGGLFLICRDRHPFTVKVTNTEEAVCVPTNKKGQVETENETYYTRPMLDYDMTLFLSPIAMAGAAMGLLIQRTLPNWLYLLLATVVLSFTAYMTFKKYRETHQKEVATRKEMLRKSSELTKEEDFVNALPLDRTVETRAASLGDSSDADGAEQHPASSELKHEETGETEEDESANDTPTKDDTGMTEVEKAEHRRYWLERDARQYPTDRIVGLFVLWGVSILLTFLKGGKGVESIVGITCSSAWYAVLVVTQFVWFFGISGVFGYHLLKETAEKKACDYPFRPLDVVWDFKQARFWAFASLITGMVAALVGIGGGMLLGPLMLVMGINPHVSAALNIAMVGLTSSSLAIIYVTVGLVPWEYAVTFFCICTVGAYVGKTKIDAYVKRTGRASLLILGLASIIGIATVGCMTIFFMRLKASDWCFDGFKKYCSASEDNPEGDFMCPVDRMLLAAVPFKY